MNDRFTFINHEFVGIVLCSTILLLICFVWKEWKNGKRDKFLIRVLISFLTIICLMMMALKPAYTHEIRGGEAVILTTGFDTAQLDSLKSEHKKLRIMDYNSNPSLVQGLDSVTSAIILGDGIETYDLWQFSKIPTLYLPSKSADGMIKLKYQKEVFVGSEITVQGAYKNPRKQTHLVLADPGGNVLDSVILRGDGIQKFQLKSEAKVVGNLVYDLLEKDSTGTIHASEPLPIIVTDKKPLRILMLNTFPTFETKYLKNLLVNRGHKLLVRSQLTKNRYKFEYYNTAKVPIFSLTDDALSLFDVLIIDADAYGSLSLTSKKILENAIANYGMGMFIQPNEAFFKLPESQSYFKVLRDNRNEIIVENNSKATLQKYPFQFEPTINGVPIVMNSAIEIGASKFMGLGRVASTNIMNTYQLVLDGKQTIYDSFWTRMLDVISRKKQGGASWEALSKFPKVNAPFEFSLRTFEKNPAVLIQNGSQIPMLQDMHVLSLIHI